MGTVCSVGAVWKYGGGGGVVVVVVQIVIVVTVAVATIDGSSCNSPQMIVRAEENCNCNLSDFLVRRFELHEQPFRDICLASRNATTCKLQLVLHLALERHFAVRLPQS